MSFWDCNNYENFFTYQQNKSAKIELTTRSEKFIKKMKQNKTFTMELVTFYFSTSS